MSCDSYSAGKEIESFPSLLVYFTFVGGTNDTRRNNDTKNEILRIGCFMMN
jgi:hypothetical protein